MPKGLLSNRLNSFQESELSFENSGIGCNGLRSSRIRKTKKKMNSKVDEDKEALPCLSIGKFGTCGPGASYRVPKPRRNCCRELRQTDTSGTGIEFDAQVSCFNTNVPPRRCCAPNLQLNLPNYNSFA